ncbi:hypothetical protein [Delftia sp. CH05]|uniref:hypothetical protein n=1 Tax=Delftia sp. CH05 TaxID=2692194 RepID=UPI00135E74CD|nr:hypothetical protein [Delftia sp. CH05]MXN29192.1 hypothetical protein [Delftia sp. CH05]
MNSLKKDIEASAAVTPFGYVNTHTGQFFTDVEPCRQGNEGHWRTVYLQPAAVAPQGEYPSLPEPVADWVQRGSVSTGGGSLGHEIGREGVFTAAQMRTYFDLGRQAAPALEAPAAPGNDLALIVAALEHSQPQMAHYAEPRERHAQALAAARRLAAAPQAPAAPSAIATQVIENLLQLARIVNVAVEDWGETKEDDSLHVIFHKEQADKLEEILEFFDSLPDAPESEGVILSGPSRAARVLRAQAAPAAPAAPAVDASDDKALLDFLRDTSCDLRSIDVPTGGDDSDVHWRVIEHYMSEPREREIGRSWSDDPREAIRAAIAAQAKEGGEA